MVVAYHHLGEPQGDLHSITWDRFEAQLTWLQEHAAPVPIKPGVSLPATYLELEGEPGFILTFDDGWLEHKEAAQRLEARGLRGIFGVVGNVLAGCVPAALAGHELASRVPYPLLLGDLQMKIASWRYLLPRALPSDEAEFKRLMQVLPPAVRERWAQWWVHEGSTDAFMIRIEVMELAERGHIIAAHSTGHDHATNLSREQLRMDAMLMHSVLLGIDPQMAIYPIWVYPHGSNSTETRHVLRVAGYSCQMVLRDRLWRPSEGTIIPRMDAARLA